MTKLSKNKNRTKIRKYNLKIIIMNNIIYLAYFQLKNGEAKSLLILIPTELRSPLLSLYLFMILN